MDFLKIDATSKSAVINSFDKIADELFYKYQLQVNDNYYQLIDIEFYYFTQESQDIHTHQHESQKNQEHGIFIDLELISLSGTGKIMEVFY